MVDVLAIQFNVAECEIGWTPVPDRVTVAGELVALLVTVTLPVTLPVPDGANVTLSVAVCPGVRICPVEIPASGVNPAPEMVIFETVTLEFPALVNVTPRVVLLPMLTFAKLRLVELKLSRNVAAFTVSVAKLLVTLPAPFVTVTVN